MSADWYRLRNDRQMRYAGRVLPTDRPITLRLDPRYGATYAGQVALLVAANLLARMTPAIALDVRDQTLVEPLPWAGAALVEAAISVMSAADPYATFEVRTARPKDHVLNLGPGVAEASVHGVGWQAYVGPGPSPLNERDSPNPIGPALAVVVAVARLFGLEMPSLGGPFLFNAFLWNATPEPEPRPFQLGANLGTLWTVGAGSVGTATLYFLTLASRQFRALTFDMDTVKTENLDRSPVFAAADAQQRLNKAVVATSYLRRVGVTDAEAECVALDASRSWIDRPAGTPDLVIAAANERNVRYVIEQSCPPLQIYGTTGANWVASVLRHIPLVEPCSCCVFPPDLAQPPTTCAEGLVPLPSANGSQNVDAALPFLSFAAGLMCAAEVFKAALPGFPFSPARTVLSLGPWANPRFTSFDGVRRDSCVCSDRNARVHRQMIAGSQYAVFSA